MIDGTDNVRFEQQYKINEIKFQVIYNSIETRLYQSTAIFRSDTIDTVWPSRIPRVNRNFV